MEKKTGLKQEQLDIIRKAKGSKKGIELSKETGIDPRRISKIFNGERKPSLAEAHELSRALSLPLNNFLADDKAKILNQIAVSAGITNGAIIGRAAASSIIPAGIITGGVGLIAGALISTILSKRKSKEFTKQEEYKQDIDDIKKEIKILSKEEREELINLIQECNDEY